MPSLPAAPPPAEIVDSTAALVSAHDSPLYNDDLAPIPPAGRKWGLASFAALWISMAACIPTYMLSAGLMAAGMSWAQALFTVGLGNTIVLVTHEPDVAAFAYRSIHIRDGQVENDVRRAA